MMSRHLPIILVLLIYLAVGSLYAVFTPVWQAPDEPAHYNYIRQLAGGTWPVIESGDYDQEYQGTVISSRFDPQYSILPFSYEDWQPPFYYLLQVPVFRLFDGVLIPLRLVSVLLGAGVVAAAYGIGRRVWTGRYAPALALTTAIFVAFLPQHLAMMASVNNDSLAELLIALILLLLLEIGKRPETGDRGPGTADGGPQTGDRGPGTVGSRPILNLRSWAGRRWLLIGLLLGLGFVTKATVYIMVPVVGITLLRLYGRKWSLLWRAGLLVAIPAGLLGLLWWGRNLAVYPGLDPLATLAHDAVVVGQPRTSEWLALYGPVEFAARFIRTTFQSFWGQFGWMAAPMPGWVYLPLLALLLVAGGGLAFSAWDRRPETGDRRRRTADRGPQNTEDDQQSTVNSQQSTVNDTTSPVPGPRSPVSSAVRGLPSVVLLSTFLLTLLVYFYYNATFVQHQGRYLFPALIPIAVGVTQGLWVVARPVLVRLPAGVWWLPAGLGLAFVALDLLALFRFIIPYLSYGVK